MEQRKRIIPPRSSFNEPNPPSDGEYFAKPDFDFPDIPRDITIVSDEHLMRMFAGFVAWQNYAATQFAEAEIVEARAEAHVRRLEAQGMLLSSAEKVTVARAELVNNPEVERARQELLIAYAHRKMTSVIYGNCERSAALISRELTRRVGREPVERRNQRWNA